MQTVNIHIVNIFVAVFIDKLFIQVLGNGGLASLMATPARMAPGEPYTIIDSEISIPVFISQRFILEPGKGPLVSRIALPLSWRAAIPDCPSPTKPDRW